MDTFWTKIKMIPRGSQLINNKYIASNPHKVLQDRDKTLSYKR